MTGPEMATTLDRLLGGRVLFEQPRHGYRAAIDPVLLAAAVPARPGEIVLDVGIGAGAAALCLCARTSAGVIGIERDPFVASLARANGARNRFAIEVVTGDIAVLGSSIEGGPVEHAMANPPYWDVTRSTASPERLRADAAHAEPDGLADWCRTLARNVRSSGSVTLILPAERWLDASRGLEAAGIGSLCLLPVLPRQGQAARRIVLQGRKAGRSPARIVAPLVLHPDEGSGYTKQADAILREGLALQMDGA